MNKIIFAVVATLGMLVMAGCTKDAINDHTDDVEEFTLTSYAAAPDTRMVINGDKQSGFATAWEAGDEIGVYAMPESTEGANPANFTCNLLHKCTVANGIATFKGIVRSTNKSDYNLFAYYPHTDGSDEDDTAYQRGVQCAIATSQKMNGNSFDKACAYMVAKTGQTINTSYNTKTIDWQFRHTVAFVNINTKSITTTDVDDAEIVERVKIEAVGQTLGGNFLFNLENGAMTFTEPQSAITTTVPSKTQLSDLSAWFVTNPFELTKADNFIVTIVTDTHAITKTVHIDKAFKAANVYTLNLSIDGSCTIIKRATYKLTFPDDNKAYNKTIFYTKTWTAKIGDYSWTIANFSNYQWNNSWKYIKCGNSNAASVASISTDWAIAEAITKVTVYIRNIDSGAAKSAKLLMAADKEFTNVLDSVAIDAFPAGFKVCKIATPTPNCYYKVEFDCAKKSSNGTITIGSVEYTNVAE